MFLKNCCCTSTAFASDKTCSVRLYTRAGSFRYFFIILKEFIGIMAQQKIAKAIKTAFESRLCSIFLNSYNQVFLHIDSLKLRHRPLPIHQNNLTGASSITPTLHLSYVCQCASIVVRSEQSTDNHGAADLRLKICTRVKFKV